MKPASAAISSPPSAASASSGPAAIASTCRSSARSMTADLAGERGVVDAGAPAGDLGGRPAGERGDEGGGRCGVADAHLAGDEAAGAVRHEHRRHLGADVERGRRLRRRSWPGPRRGWRSRPPPCAPSSPGCSSRGAATPDVDDQHAGAVLPGQHVDGRAAGAEVGHHLGGDLLGPRRHALGDDAVVAGEDGDGGRERAAAAGSGRRCRRAVARATSSRPSAPGGLVRRPVERCGLRHGRGIERRHARQRRRERTAHRRRRYPARFGRSRSTVSGTFRP